MNQRQCIALLFISGSINRTFSAMRLDDLRLIARCRYDALLLTLSLIDVILASRGRLASLVYLHCFGPRMKLPCWSMSNSFMFVGIGPGFRIGTSQPDHCDISSFEGVLPRHKFRETLGPCNSIVTCFGVVQRV